MSTRHGLGTVQEKNIYHDQKQFGYAHSFWGQEASEFHLASEPEKIHLPELFSNTEEAKLTEGRTSQ